MIGSFVQSQRGSLVAQANRRTRSQSLQSSSNRTRTRVTHSARMAQMRNQFFGGSHRVSTRQRNVNFPMHMDLDMVITSYLFLINQHFFSVIGTIYEIDC